MEITITKIKTKDGQGQKGPWKLTKWTDGEDTVWSTFDKKARGVKVGAVVDIPEWDSDEYGNDFQKWTLIADATPESTAAAQATNGAAEREKTLSIERQSSAATILQYIAATAEHGNLTQDLGDAAKKALAWLSSRFDDAPVGKLTHDEQMDQRTQADQDFDKLESDSRFKTVGELRKWCADEGVDTAKFCELVKVKETDIPKVNIDEAHQIIKDYLAGK